MTNTDRTRDGPAAAHTQRKPMTDEQRARYNLRARLKSIAAEIGQLVDDVTQRHSDPSGNFHWGWLPPPEDNSDLRGLSETRPRLLDRWDRIKREAAAGCADCAEFVTHWEPTLALAMHMRQERPPARAVDYDPSQFRHQLTDDQREFLKGRKR